MRPGVHRSARILCSAGILAAALVLCARDAVAQAVPWADPAYSSAREVTLTAGTAPIPVGSLVSLTFDHAALVAAGASLSSGNDVRLAYRSGGIVTEIPRALANGFAWNNAGTQIFFKTQAALAAAASDANYFLYYGNPSATAPSTAGVPTARTYKTEVLAEQSTINAAFTDVPGATLTFTPGQASENWIVFATGVLRSTSTGLITSEMQLLVNGAPVDMWGQRNRDGGTPNGSGFLIFHRVTGSATPQVLQLQFRAGAGTTFAGSLRLVAVLVPENADLRFIDTPASVQFPKNSANVEIQALTFTPPTAGDYYIFGKTCHSDPGGGTVQTWIEDDTAVLHPDTPAGVHYSNPGTTFASLSVAFRKTLPASSRTFRIRGTTGGNNGSIWQNRKMMAFRADAWELQEYSEALPQTSISASTALQIKNSLTTLGPPAERDYLVLQMARISGNADQTLQKSGVFLDGGVTLLRTDHRINNDDGSNVGYHHVAALVNVKTTGAAATYNNGFQSSSLSNGDNVNCAESVIASFRYLQPTVTQRPLVRDVSSTALNAVYGPGALLPIQVRFSEAVTVTGTPLLTLETGAADAVVSYASGSGTNTLTFNYTVVAGHQSADLDYVAVGSLALNGGTIRDAAGLNAGLLLPAPGTPGSLGAFKNLVIDTIPPGAPGLPVGAPNPSGPAGFTVTWTAATDSGGSGSGTVTYTVERSSNGGSTWGPPVTGIVGTSLVQSGLAQGSYVYRVSAVDLAGNVGPLSGVSAPVFVDATAPVVSSITAGNPSPTNLASVTYTVTFSESVVAVDAADFTLPLTVSGAGISGVTGSGTTWTVTVNTGTASGTLQLGLVAAPSIQDMVGNILVGPFPAAPIYTVDKTGPTVLSMTAGNPLTTNLAAVTYTVTFSEAVVNVDTADFALPVTVAGASVSGVSGSGTTWTVTVNTGTGSGSLRLGLVAAPSIQDVLGNTVVGPFPAASTYTVDKISPTVSSITAGNPLTTNLPSVTYTVTFSESVVNVDTADFTLPLTVAGASISGVSGSGTTWTVTINTGTGSGSLQLALVAAPTIQDPAGNTVVGPFPSAPTYTVDKSAPTVSSITAGNPLATNLASVTYTVTFSEAVVNVDTADFALPLTVAGAGISGVSGSGTTWTVTVNTGTGSGSLQLGLVVAPTIQDTVGDALVGPFPAAPIYTVDKVAPTVSSITAGNPLATSLPSVTYTVTFSESVVNVDTADFALPLTVAGASVSGVSGSGTTWTVTVNTGTGSGSLQLGLVAAPSIQDPAGNNVVGPFPAAPTYAVDKVAPTVSSITAGNPLATNLPSVTYTVTFSESVVNVDTADFALPLTVAGASVSGVSGSGTIWTVTVNTGTGSGSLQLGLVAAPSIQDLSGNTVVGPFPSAPTYTVDKTAPTVLSITAGNPLPTNLASVTYTVTFSEAVVNVDTADFTLPLTVAGATVSGVSGSGTTWTVTINTGTGSGSLQLALVAAPTIQDLGGNTVVGPFPAAPTYTVDKVAPTVSSITAGNPSPTNLASVTYTVTFSETVVNVDTADFTLPLTVAGATVSGVSGSGTTWTVTVNTGTGSGNLQLALVAAPSIQDPAGNTVVGPFPSAPTYTVDKTAPTVLSITAGNPLTTNLPSVTYTVTFSEAVVNVDVADFNLPLTVTGAGISGVTGSGTTWTVTINTGTGSGSLQLGLVAAPTIQDTVGDALVGPFPVAPTYTVDKSAPTVSSITAGNPLPTNLASVTYTVTFSEAVVNVDTGDFTLPLTVAGAGISGVSGSGTTWTVTVNTGTGSGSLQLALVAAPTIQDTLGDALVGPFPSAPTYTVDKSTPVVSSIVLVSPTPTNLGTISYTVTFSESVTGVDSGDFALAMVGLSGASIGGVSGAGTTWTVSVLTGTGDGTITLKLVDDDSIQDAVGNLLGGPGTGNGNLDGPACTIDKTAPTVSLSGPSASPVTTGPVSFTVTYGGATTLTLALPQVSLNSTGTATGTLSLAPAGPSAYTVTISALSGSGTVGISIASGTASDAAGNSAPAAGPSPTAVVDNSGVIGLPTALQTETLTNPSGLLRVPRFSAVHNWENSNPLNAETYKIQVSTDASFGTITHWDSPAGQTFPGAASVAPGARSPLILYGTAGSPLALQWNSQYYWRTRFGDSGGGLSGFSTEAASFFMGIPAASSSANGNGSPTVDSFRYIGFPIAVGTSVPATELLRSVSYVFRWEEPTRQYVQITAADVIEGGRGYLAYAPPGTIINLMMGSVPVGNQPMNLSYTTLGVPAGPEITEGRPAEYYRGAHFLANPFNEAISWDNPPTGLVDKPNLSETYFKWDGSQYLTYNSATQLGAAGATIVPFQAFGVNVLSSTAGADLVFNAPASSNPPQFLKMNLMAGPAVPDTEAWSLHIVADSAGAQDTENYLGVNPQSQDTWDRRDGEEPGHAAATWVNVYLDHTDWTARPRCYTHDYRKTPTRQGDEVVWDATVETNSGAPVTLTWPNIAQLPLSDWTFTIEDSVAGTITDMSTSPSIQLSAFSGKRQVRVVAHRTKSAPGQLEVSMVAGGSPPGTVTAGTTGVHLMDVDVIAHGEAVTVGKMIVRHVGTGDPTGVLVTLFAGTQQIAGPTAFGSATEIVWTGLGRSIAEGSLQTWSLVYDFPADSLGTYRVTLLADEVEGVGESSGRTLKPAAAALVSPEVTVTGGTVTTTGNGSTSSGGGGGGGCGLLGVECLVIMALIRRLRRREEVRHVRV